MSVTRYTNEGHKFIVDGNIAVGSSVTVTIVPADGYYFVQWLNLNNLISKLDDDDDGHKRYSLTIEECGLSFAALFNTNGYYSVTVTVEEGQKEYGTVTGGGTEIEHGSIINISASPVSDDYRFSYWKEDGNTESDRSITVTENCTYTAIFEINSITISGESSDNNMGSVSGSSTVKYGEIVTLTAIPNDNYHFVMWDDEDIDNPRKITATESLVYTANFALDKITIVGIANNEIYGEVTGTTIVDYGTYVTLTATPNENYQFVKWDDGYVNPSRTVIAVQDTLYTAIFALNQVTINAISDNISMGTALVNGSESVSVDYGTSVKLLATPIDACVFSEWNDGNDNMSRSIKAVSDTTYTAYFNTKMITIDGKSSDNNGNVYGSGTYKYGSSIELTAVPNTGYVFKDWDDSTTDNPRTIVATTNSIYLANFIESQPYTIKLVSYPEEGGTANGSGVYYTGHELSISATAKSGYAFAGWYTNDAFISNANPYTFIVSQDITITAKFEASSYERTFRISDNGDGTILYTDTITEATYTSDTFPQASKQYNIIHLLIPPTVSLSVSYTDISGTANIITEDGTYTSYEDGEPEYNITRDDKEDGTIEIIISNIE